MAPPIYEAFAKQNINNAHENFFNNISRDFSDIPEFPSLLTDFNKQAEKEYKKKGILNWTPKDCIAWIIDMIHDTESGILSEYQVPYTYVKSKRKYLLEKMLQQREYTIYRIYFVLQMWINQKSSQFRENNFSLNNGGTGIEPTHKVTIEILKTPPANTINQNNENNKLYVDPLTNNTSKREPAHTMTKKLVLPTINIDYVNEDPFSYRTNTGSFFNNVTGKEQAYRDTKEINKLPEFKKQIRDYFNNKQTQLRKQAFLGTHEITVQSKVTENYKVNSDTFVNKQKELRQTDEVHTIKNKPKLDFDYDNHIHKTKIKQCFKNATEKDNLFPKTDCVKKGFYIKDIFPNKDTKHVTNDLLNQKNTEITQSHEVKLNKSPSNTKYENTEVNKVNTEPVLKKSLDRKLNCPVTNVMITEVRQDEIANNLLGRKVERDSNQINKQVVDKERLLFKKSLLSNIEEIEKKTFPIIKETHYAPTNRIQQSTENYEINTNTYNDVTVIEEADIETTEMNMLPIDKAYNNTVVKISYQYSQPHKVNKESINNEEIKGKQSDINTKEFKNTPTNNDLISQKHTDTKNTLKRNSNKEANELNKMAKISKSLTLEGINRIQNLVKRPRGRPRKDFARPIKREAKFLPEFLADMLLNPEYCPNFIRWENYTKRTFELVNLKEVITLWKIRHNKDSNLNNIDFQSFTRAMRYHYTTKKLKVPKDSRYRRGAKLYQFGDEFIINTDDPNFTKKHVVVVRKSVIQMNETNLPINSGQFCQDLNEIKRESE